MSPSALTRRQLLAGARPTIDSGPRLTPLDEIVMVPEFEESARLALPASAFSTIAGTSREPLDRITVRSRMLIPTMEMDLSVQLFGDTLFTPILVGPVSDQKRFHTEAEMATVRGAGAGRAAVVISSRSSVPIEQLASAAVTPLWFQVWAEPGARPLVQRAASAGVRALVVTLGTAAGGAPAKPDWTAIEGLRAASSLPMLVKGVTTPAAAKLALQHGAQGLIVSNSGTGNPHASILAVPSIVDEVGGDVPVLVDGSFRLGVDVYKALALGAKSVLIGRPAMWALAAYGAAGVQTMVEILQTEFAQTMSACSKPNLAALDRQSVKIHSFAME